MNLQDEARRLLSCEELRGRVPEEVADFLRMVAGLELVAYVRKEDVICESHPWRWDLCDLRDRRERANHCPLYILAPPAMTPSEAAAILKKHNEWRRFNGAIDDTPEMPSPKLIGEAIDAAVKYIEDNDHE